MPSHKQKKEKKRSHKHKRRNRDRSAAKRREKRNEGKKENIPHNESAWNTEVRDVSTCIDNRREMIRQIFSSVGEEFMANEVPRILQQATRDEVKKTCLEELRRMSKDVIVKILEGIPVDDESNENSTEELPIPENEEMKSSESLHGHTSGLSSTCVCGRGNEEREEPLLNLDRDEDEIGIEECAGGSKDPETSSSEGSPSENEGDESESPEEICRSRKEEAPSTSYQQTMPKKLAKVAPFSIRVKTVEELTAPPAPSVEARQSNDEEGDSESYDMVDLGLEEGIDGMEDTNEVELGSPENDVSDNQIVSEEEMLQNLSEVRELEHRARAIRSMLANIDKLQT